MKQPHQSPQQRDHAEPGDSAHADAPRTDQRAGPVATTDAQYGTRSAGGAAERASADPARPGKQPTRGSAQTGLTGSVGQLDADAQNIQRPGGANPSAQSSTDWQAQRGDQGALPDTASEQARAAAASAGHPSQDQRGGMRIDRGAEGEGNRDQPRSAHGSQPKRSTYPGQGPGEAHGASKYNATGNEQDRLSQDLGGESLREDAPSAGTDDRAKALRKKR